jgi:uncharacterized membrane protein YedE/YeeE
MFETPDTLALGFATGVAFGFLLQKGGVAKYQTILGQLLLKNFAVLKIMTTAIVVGALGVYLLAYAGVTYLDIWPLQWGGILLGALLFGIGLAVFGYCPGTSVAASGEGSRDAMAGVAGMFAGSLLFVVQYGSFHDIIMALGDFGKLTVPDVLGLSPWLVIVAITLGVGALFALIERYESRLRARAT